MQSAILSSVRLSVTLVDQDQLKILEILREVEQLAQPILF